MSSLSPDRAPIEIWEKILQEVISFDSNIAIQTTCFPETYLAFKESCAEGIHNVSRESYKVSEKNRRIIRLVCRSWNTFADDWKYQDRWVRLLPGSGDSICTQWEHPLRLDLEFASFGFVHTKWCGPKGLVQQWFKAWRDRDPIKHRPMQLVRLELISMYPTTAFDEIFEALCGASGQLGRLRSLTLNILERNPWILDALSESFPQLTHLTLNMWFDNEPTSHHQAHKSQHTRGALTLKCLEVLLLCADPGCFDLTHWLLPKLHTIHADPFSSEWNHNIFPFLRRHASTIITLDLDAFRYRTQRQFTTEGPALPIGFWDQFSRLQFFRTRLSYTQIVEIPKKDHPLRWAVYVNPLSNALDWFNVMRIWATPCEDTKPRQILIHGRYTMNISDDDLGGAVGTVMKGLISNGIELVRVS